MEEEKRKSADAAKETADKAPGGEGASPEGQLAAQIADMAKDAAKAAGDMEALQAENSELKDKNLRLVAEMENLRRRTERDKNEFSKYAISEFARDIVGVGDNIRRAIEAVPKDAAASDPAVRSLVEGVEVTERELLKVLERYQVTRFDPLGEPFNPHLHDAMTKVEVPNVPAETVVQVIHAGYMIGERVLRPAAVIVAKGGTATEQPQKSGGEAESGPETIPLGAMKIPDDAVSSASEAAIRGQLDTQQTVFGRHLSNEKRRPSLQSEALTDERVAQFRRNARQGGGGGGGAREQPRQQASAQHKPASLVKPVIPKAE